MSPLKDGSKVGERFTIVRRAGEGGTAEVYEAIDAVTQRKVAIKLMRPEVIDASRFAREAKILEDVPHASVVRHVAHGTLDDGRAYLALEWIEGETLAARLQRGPLFPQHAVRLLASAARTLGDLHAIGVVHRDVKPSNLMIRPGADDTVVVMDFGLARATGAAQSTAFMGTPAYGAPEQVSGAKDVDARADVYSLGAVLFECLTGRPLFVGDDAISVLTKIALEEPPALASLRPDLPRELAAAVDRAVRKERHDRPADGTAFAAELATVPSIAPRVSVVPGAPEAHVRRSEPPRRPSQHDGVALFVGREKELTLVTATYAACVEDSSARAILVTAPAAYGKTRFGEEAILRLARQETAPNVIMARSIPHRSRIAHALVAQIVERAIEVDDGASEPVIKAALRAYAQSSADPAHTIASLEELLAPRVPYITPDPTKSLDDAWAARDRMRAAFRECLELELAPAPLVLLLDDLQLADAASVRLVDVMLEQLVDRSLLILALARPEVDHRFPTLWRGRNVLRVVIAEPPPRDAA